MVDDPGIRSLPRVSQQDAQRPAAASKPSKGPRPVAGWLRGPARPDLYAPGALAPPGSDRARREAPWATVRRFDASDQPLRRRTEDAPMPDWALSLPCASISSARLSGGRGPGEERVTSRLPMSSAVFLSLSRVYQRTVAPFTAAGLALDGTGDELPSLVVRRPHR